MENQIQIQDESGDKKYFTQIPNMIVNHSTAYEQSLYLIMKRLAGEHGSCWASLNWLAKKMGVHKITVSKTITKLLKRKWIKETEKKNVRGGTVRQFLIVDLWAINIKKYESGAEMTTKQSGAVVIESGAVVIESGAVVIESGAQSDTKKNHEEESWKKNHEEKPYTGDFGIKVARVKNDIEKLVDYYLELKDWDNQPKEFYKENGISYARCCAAAKDILELANSDLEVAKEKLLKTKEKAESNSLEWVMETLLKWWIEFDKI